jgi:CubicO group peptidase (beta-lactamase class C family)
MNNLLKALSVLTVVLLILVLGLYLSGNSYLIKGVWATYLHGESSATITDKDYFEQRIVANGVAQPWLRSTAYNRRALPDTLKKYLEDNRTVAFLIVKEDSIIQENYWAEGGPESQTNSFSMAKSITTMLAQLAVQQNIFKSWEEPVKNYLPELEGAYSNQLKLKHLAEMSAGLRWNEHYKNPFDITARAYYGADIKKLMLKKVPVIAEPGTEYEYQSGATQLLGLALMEATGKSLAQLASEWLWIPLGAEQSASWHLDTEDGRELAYCCFNSNARDFARLGQLLLHEGNWNGLQILDSSFVKVATRPKLVDYYGRSFWLDSDDHLSPIFYLRGILGQYVIVIPEKEMVIVRLGHQRMEKKEDEHPEDFHIYVRQSLKYFGH